MLAQSLDGESVVLAQRRIGAEGEQPALGLERTRLGHLAATGSVLGAHCAKQLARLYVRRACDLGQLVVSSSWEGFRTT